jgi:ADP-heptose:LPS heptosyltransferase
VPICFTLSIVRALASPFRRRSDSPARSILFVKLAEQGSTVLAYPALRRAVEQVGRENVYFLVFDANRFIVDVLDVIPPENVIPIRADSLVSSILSSLAAILKMRRLRLDAAIDAEFFARSSAIFTYLSGARLRAGFHAYAGDGPYRGHLMTHPLVYNPHLHTSQIFLMLVEALSEPEERFPGFSYVSPPLDQLPLPSFRPSNEEHRTVEALVCGATGLDRIPPLILLNANCSDLLPLRKWEQANYVALARRLLAAHPDLFVAFTGAPDEALAVEPLAKEIDSTRCISLAGKTTLRQLLVLYGLARVLVTNDSGPAHFATLTPVDVVTLFGPETPKLFGAPSPRSHIVWASTACSPCVNAYNNRLSRCHDNVCMQRISVDEVFELTREVLEARSTASVAETP